MELNGFWSSVSNFYIQNSTFTFKKQINSTSDAKKKKGQYILQTLDNWEAVS